MANYISKTGAWDIKADETQVPSLNVEKLESGKTVKVTCQFFGRTMTDDLLEGYEYCITESNGSLITLTPDMGLVQGSDSWQLFTHIVLFEVPTAITKAEFKLHISKGETNGQGLMMNYLLMAEIID